MAAEATLGTASRSVMGLYIDHVLEGKPLVRGGASFLQLRRHTAFDSLGEQVGRFGLCMLYFVNVVQTQIKPFKETSRSINIRFAREDEKGNRGKMRCIKISANLNSWSLPRQNLQPRYQAIDQPLYSCHPTVLSVVSQILRIPAPVCFFFVHRPRNSCTPGPVTR